MTPPSIGRIVHCTVINVDDGSTSCVAGIVTAVHDEGRVSLHIFGPLNDERVAGVRYDEQGQPGTWHWPERI